MSSSISAIIYDAFATTRRFFGPARNLRVGNKRVVSLSIEELSIIFLGGLADRKIQSKFHDFRSFLLGYASVIAIAECIAESDDDWKTRKPFIPKRSQEEFARFDQKKNGDWRISSEEMQVLVKDAEIETIAKVLFIKIGALIDSYYGDHRDHGKFICSIPKIDQKKKITNKIQHSKNPLAEDPSDMTLDEFRLYLESPVVWDDRHSTRAPEFATYSDGIVDSWLIGMISRWGSIWNQLKRLPSDLELMPGSYIDADIVINLDDLNAQFDENDRVEAARKYKENQPLRDMAKFSAAQQRLQHLIPGAISKVIPKSKNIQNPFSQLTVEGDESSEEVDE